jgi:hypothetical protein
LKKSSIHLQPENLQLYGLVSTEKDYRLVYFLNQTIGTDLIKAEDFFDVSVQEKLLQIPYYSCSDFDFDYVLLANKHQGLSLLNKYKNINYWLILKQIAFEYNYQEFENKLQSSKAILGSFNITDQKEKERLSKLLFS